LTSLLAEASKEKAALKKQVEQQDLKLKNYRKEIEGLQSIRAEVMSSFSSMQGLLRDKDKQLDECKKDCESLRSHSADERSTVEAQLEQREIELEEVCIEIDSLRSIHAIVCSFSMALEEQARDRETRLDECAAEIEMLKTATAGTDLEKRTVEEQAQLAEKELEEYKSQLQQELYEEMFAVRRIHAVARTSWQARLLRDARRASDSILCTCWSAWRHAGQQRRHSRLLLALGSFASNTRESSWNEAFLKMCCIAWHNAVPAQGPISNSDKKPEPNTPSSPTRNRSGLGTTVVSYARLSREQKAAEIQSPSPDSSDGQSPQSTSPSAPSARILQGPNPLGSQSPRPFATVPQRVASAACSPGPVPPRWMQAGPQNSSVTSIAQTPKSGSDPNVFPRIATPSSSNVKTGKWKP
jgi:hypothetical protein